MWYCVKPKCIIIDRKRKGSRKTTKVSKDQLMKQNPEEGNDCESGGDIPADVLNDPKKLSKWKTKMRGQRHRMRISESRYGYLYVTLRKCNGSVKCLFVIS